MSSIYSLHSCFDGKHNNQNSCKIIKVVSKIRYLGIIFDNNFKCSLHINNLIDKLRSITLIIINLLNIKSNIQIYNAYRYNIFYTISAVYQYGEQV